MMTTMTSKPPQNTLPFEGVYPSLSPGCFIAPGAQVMGQVTLGQGSSVWYNCVLRGDVLPIRVGARTNIQDLSVLHVSGPDFACTIGDDVTVGHRAIIHGCTIKDRCLIGMGAIILDGAIIEDDCIIAAGALVPPGKHIPAGSLVMGSPGKVVRQVSAQDRENILHSAQHYVALAQQHLLSLSSPS